MDVRIEGANQLEMLARRLKAAGDEGKGFRKELYKGIQRATKAPKADARSRALATLPHTGGLAAAVAKSKISTRTRGGGKTPGVRIVAVGQATRSTDQGHVRHPVFGRRGTWVTQAVHGGWFTDAMKAGAPAVRTEILQAMQVIAEQIAKGRL